MKSIKIKYLLTLSTLLISFSLSGCYTQLAFVDDDKEFDSGYYLDASNYKPVYTYVPVPVYEPPPAPIISVLPVVGTTKVVYNPPPAARTQEPTRERPMISRRSESTSSETSARTDGSRHRSR